MAQTWDADVAIDLGRAHETVIAQFSEFVYEVPALLGEGWDNICIRYPDNTVFRLPRRKLGGELIEFEIRVLPTLRTRLPLPIPDIRWVGSASEIFPYSFVGYPMLPGQTADRISWTTEQRAASVPTLARFLRELHQIPTNQRPFDGLPPDTLLRKDPAALLARIEMRAEKISGQLEGIDVPAIVNWARNVAATVVPTNKRGLVHGDLYPRHLLANEDRDITAIIDWGDAHIGHPAIDLSIAYSFVPEESRDEFFQLYGLPVEPADRQMAELRARMYGFGLTAYGLDVGDAAVLELGRSILQFKR